MSPKLTTRIMSGWALDDGTLDVHGEGRQLFV